MKALSFYNGIITCLLKALCPQLAEEVTQVFTKLNNQKSVVGLRGPRSWPGKHFLQGWRKITRFPGLWGAQDAQSLPENGILELRCLAQIQLPLKSTPRLLLMSARVSSRWLSNALPFSQPGKTDKAWGSSPVTFWGAACWMGWCILIYWELCTNPRASHLTFLVTFNSLVNQTSRLWLQCLNKLMQFSKDAYEEQ